MSKANHHSTLHPYQLVQFTESEDRREVDVVPRRWISFDLSTRALLCSFMPGPYDSRKNKIIRDLVEKCSEQHEDWPKYPITISGHAGKSY